MANTGLEDHPDGWEALPEGQRLLRGPPRWPGVVGRSFQRAGSGREALSEGLDWMGIPIGVPRVVRRPPGVPRVFGRPRVGRLTTPGYLAGPPDHLGGPHNHSRLSKKASRPLPPLREGLLTTPGLPGGLANTRGTPGGPFNHSWNSKRDSRPIPALRVGHPNAPGYPGAPPDHPGGPCNHSRPSRKASRPLPAIREDLPTTPGPPGEGREWSGGPPGGARVVGRPHWSSGCG